MSSLMPTMVWRSATLVVALAVTTAACGGSSGNNGASGAGNGAAQGAIDQKATLTVGLLATVQSLDPHLINTTSPVHLQAWDRLLTLDPDGILQPMVAKEWTFTPEGDALIVKLREDVKFHDGTPVDALAVKASLERAKTLDRSGVASLFSSLSSVDVVDDYMARLNLEKGKGASLPYTLAMHAGSLINPKCLEGDGDIDEPDAICTSSAMVFASGTPNDAWELKRSADPYWDPEGFRYAGIKFIPAPVSQTALGALQTGDLNVAQVVADSLGAARPLLESGAIGGELIHSSAMSTIFLNPRKPPFDDVRVRQAVQAAIDTKTLGDQLLEGNCKASQQPAAPDSPAWNRAFKESNPYNPDRARALLKEAGLPNGFKTSVLTTGISLNTTVGEAVQAQLKEVGIDMKLQVVDTPAVPEIRSGDAQASLLAWGSSIDSDLTLDFVTNLGAQRLAPVLGSDIEDEILTKRSQALDPTLSPQQRGGIYQDIWQQIYDNALVVNLCQLVIAWPHTTDLQNADLLPYTKFSAGLDLRHVTVKRG